MPRYTVYLQRECYEYNSVEVEADSPDDAETKVGDMIFQGRQGNDTFPPGFHDCWAESAYPGDIESQRRRGRESRPASRRPH